MDYSITLSKISDTEEQINSSMEEIREIHDQIVMADWMLTTDGWSGLAAEAFIQCDQEFSQHLEQCVEHWQEADEILKELSMSADDINKFAKDIETIWLSGVLPGAQVSNPISIPSAKSMILSAEKVSLDRGNYETVRSECGSLQKDYAEQNKRLAKIGSLNSMCRYYQVPSLDSQLQLGYKEIEELQNTLSEYIEAMGKYKDMVDKMEEKIAGAATALPVS